MSNRKLVMEEHEGKVLMGIQQEGCDPVVKTVEGNLDAALEQVPGMLTEAQEKWATSPKMPAYKPPKEPVVAAAPAQKADELPLLSGQEKPAAQVIEESEASPELKEKAKAELESLEAEVETEGKVTEPTGTAEAQAPAPAVSPEPVEEKPYVPMPESEVGKERLAQATGEWEYWLKDERGPFTDIQAAMDEMGLDKENRPHHNRWDRLSTSLKEQIQRRPKA